MLLIPSDQHRRVHLPGVAEPVRRPVDIDQALTGFAHLRTLRVYRFDQGSVIDGHAEEDEVFIVVLTGSIELTIVPALSQNLSTPVVLTAPGNTDDVACAAYLPPHAGYRLAADSEADIAYARATPLTVRAPQVLHSVARKQMPGVNIIAEDFTHAERLRFRLLHLNTQQNNVIRPLLDQSEDKCEKLVHVHCTPSGKTVKVTGHNAAFEEMHCGDTIAADQEDHPVLHFDSGTAGLVLIVMAVSS